MRKLQRNLSVILPAVALLCVASVCWAQEAQPSLGDVARQQKNTAKPKAKKVITDDDIPARPKTQGNASDAEGKEKSSEEKQGTDANSEPQNPEARAKRILEIKGYEDLLDSRIESAEELLRTVPDESQRESLRAMLDNFRSKLDENKQIRQTLEEKQAAERAKAEKQKEEKTEPEAKAETKSEEKTSEEQKPPDEGKVPEKQNPPE